MADSLSTAAQNSPAGDNAAMTRLQQLEDAMVKALPGSNLAAYVTYREMQADYAVRITKEHDYGAAQKEWVDRLTKFVENLRPRRRKTPHGRPCCSSAWSTSS